LSPVLRRYRVLKPRQREVTAAGVLADILRLAQNMRGRR
jgi:hypothetical protein